MWKKFLGIFFLLYIPLFVLSLLMLTSQRRERILDLSNKISVDAANKSFFLSDVCHYLVHNTNYWTSIEYPENFDPRGNNVDFIQPYLVVLKNLGFYDQFRIIDLSGEEMLRYQSYDGHKMVDAPLQNKVSREYVQAGLKLDKGDVYLSRIDLNRENGKIEKPFKPVLRSVAPIFDSKGQKLGLVVINFRMKDILKSLTSYAAEGNSYIIDADLNIISSNTEEFEIPNEISLANDSVSTSANIIKSGLSDLHDTTLVKSGTIWSLNKVKLDKGILRDSEIYTEPENIVLGTEWAIVTEMPAKAIQAGLWSVYQNFIVLHLFSVIALAGISYGYLKYQQEKLALVEELKGKNSTLLENKKNLEVINRQVRQTNRRLKVRNEQLEQFSYLISHNLRSPVTSMTVILDMLAKEEKIDSVKSLLPKLESIAGSVINLTEDIRNYVTILDRNEIDLQSIDLKEIISVVGKEFNEIALGKFKVESDLSAWTNVSFSKFYMRSIIQNMISNAIKYKRDDVDPYIKFKTAIEHGGKVLYIEDNGLGIDIERHKSNIFKLYKRFHRNISGKGMGLFLVKTQLEALDASISVKSITGKGTVFKIIF